MNLTREDLPDGCLIAVNEPRLDAARAIHFKDGLRALAGEGAGRIVLDLGTVEFLDSSGLGAVVAAMKLFAPDRALELAALTPPLEKVFRLTRMDGVFTIHPTADALRGALRDAG